MTALSTLNASEISEELEAIKNRYEVERKLKEDEIELLDRSFWKDLLDVIHRFFQAYESEEGTKKLHKAMFVEGGKYKISITTAKRYKKIYDYRDLQNWIRDELKITSDMIDRYKEGDLYKDIVEKAERSKNSRNENRRQRRESARRVALPSDSSEELPLHSLLEEETHQRGRKPNTSGYLYLIRMQCSSWKATDGSQLLKFGHTTEPTNLEEVYQYVRERYSLFPTVRPEIKLLINVENSFPLEQQILSEMQQEQCIFNAVNTTTSEFFSERYLSRVLHMIKKRENSLWEYEVDCVENDASIMNVT